MKFSKELVRLFLIFPNAAAPTLGRRFSNKLNCNQIRISVNMPSNLIMITAGFTVSNKIIYKEIEIYLKQQFVQYSRN